MFNRTRTWVALGGLVSTLALGACDKDASSNNDDNPRARSGELAGIGLLAAIDAARAHIDDGTLIGAELATEDGDAVYEVEYLVDDSVKEVQLAPADGSLVAIVDDSDDLPEAHAAAATLAAAKISLVDAIKAAEVAAQGTAIEVQVDLEAFDEDEDKDEDEDYDADEDEQDCLEVIVVDGTSVWEVEIDLQSGEVLELEASDEDSEGDEGDED